MWKKQSQMSFQIEVKPQRISSSNFNCPKCGYKYKSLRSYPSNLDAKIIQITECLNILGENLGNCRCGGLTVEPNILS
jgi:transcription elongation factor Elf1